MDGSAPAPSHSCWEEADIIHPQKRFFSGGANSVRGFAQNQLGPRVLTVDPARLLIPGEKELTSACAPAEIMDLTCDANSLDSGAFGTPRPTGGSKVLEGGVEYRFVVGTRVESAVFVDFGRIWTEQGSGGIGEFEISPGFGIRYLSPIGPLRVDLGYRFRGREGLAGRDLPDPPVLAQGMMRGTRLGVP